MGADILLTYYLDESGTTGDLARNAVQGFGGQPIFALACVGIRNPEMLRIELARLMRDHRVQHSELKYSSLVRKSRLVRELIAYLHEHQCPVFLEVVDKKFFIVAMMVNHLLRVPILPARFLRRWCMPIAASV